ncbi:MAG: hypothetical protein Q9207_001162 [Kuettlingeria erythrocarpa]
MAAAPLPAELERPGSSNTSSADLSTPPSPRSPSTHVTISYPKLHPHLQGGGGDVRFGEEKGAATAKDSAPKPRKPRKKKELGEANNPDNKLPTLPNGDNVPPKIKKPRAPRGTSAAAIKKKQQQELAFAAAQHPHPQPAKPPAHLLTERPGSAPSLHNHPCVPIASPRLPIGTADEAIPIPRPPAQYVMPTPPRPPSGQHYDPIRSATIEPRIAYHQQQQSQQAPLHARTSASTPPRPASHASISPSIASLLEPHSSDAPYNAILKRENDGSVTSPPEAKRQRLTPPVNIADAPQAPLQQPQAALPLTPYSSNNTYLTMDVDNDRATARPVGRPPAGTKKPSEQSSSNHSPKPSGRKDAPLPPLPPGNGLLSSAMLGGGYDSKGPGRTAPTVFLHVPLNGDSNKYVNFARLAEEQYGFDALHPRLAAQRERLARVAAAGAALENAQKAGSGRSADDMSVDLSEGEPEADNSNLETGGINGNRDAKPSEAEGSDQLGVKRRKKRTMKEDMYDKDDDFIDDTELAFEEQAAATKDGFFVYSGPLIPEGEKANIERTDGVPARGRGRGRGRGSRGGATGGTTRGGGVSADGTTKLTKSGQPRKSRMTKAAKEAMDKEKAVRESMAPLAAKPTNYPG